MTPGTIPTFRAKVANSGGGATPPSTQQYNKTFAIANGLDDGYYQVNNSNTGSMLYQGLYGGSFEIAFFRFGEVTVPKGATVNAATLQLSAQFVSGGNNSGVWRGAAVDNVEAAPARPDQFATTNANVPVTRSVGIIEHNVRAIIQEIVSRSGWASGNGLCFVGDSTIATGDTAFAAVEGSYMSKLTVTYTV